MKVYTKATRFELRLPSKVEKRVNTLATDLLKEVKQVDQIKNNNPESLLGYLTDLIRGKTQDMTFNAQKFVDLINNTKNPKMQSRMMKEFILNYAPDYFNENSVNYSKEDYLETFLPKKLTDEDFKHLQELGQRMNPPVHITDNEENRKSILDEKRANLKATLEEWFDYLNDEDGGLVYLNDDARHCILNSVVNLESRVLDDKPKLKTLETLLDKPHDVKYPFF